MAWWSGKLGAAYYNTMTHEANLYNFLGNFIVFLFLILLQLHVIPDVMENSSDMAVLRGLFFQLQPHTLIVKQSLEEKRMAHIYQLVGIEPEEVDQATDQQIWGSNLRSTVDEDDGTHQAVYQSNSSMRCYVNERDSSCHLYIVPTSFYNADAGIFHLNNNLVVF